MIGKKGLAQIGLLAGAGSLGALALLGSMLGVIVLLFVTGIPVLITAGKLFGGGSLLFWIATTAFILFFIRRR